MTEAYSKLLERFQETALLSSSASLLGWDQETYLPKKGIAFRAKQSAYFQGKIHALSTASEVGDWISACEDASNGEDTIENANVREWRHGYDRATLISQDLVEEFAQCRALALNSWQQAREESDFSVFQPHLEKLIELSIQKAEAWGYGDTRYDALLETYERGANQKSVAAVFDDLKPKIVELVAEATAGGEKENPLHGPAPYHAQQKFNREVAEAFGFDFDAGRIDTAAHPFCSGVGPGDTRMTTRYDENDFTSSLFGVMHECGHGLYDQGLDSDAHGTPVGDAVSLGIHESQSRLWENHIGRGRAFWSHWLPRAAELFPHIAGLSLDEVVRAVNTAQKSFIRVEADEVTYDLHILLRFGIESRLISGELAVADLPAAWNEEFENMFGLKVDKDSNGCLQDIHWSMGAFGYFPTYTLGNLNAAQLFKYATTKNGDVATAIDAGNFAPLLGWLRENVHVHGSRYMPQDLIERVTGETTQAQYHLEHLRERYL